MTDMYVIVKTVGSTPHVFGAEGGGVFTDVESAQAAADRMDAGDEARLEVQPILPASQGS